MATYPPPTETLPTFNSIVFTTPLTDALTIAEADTRYLRFPIGQGDETISNLTVSGTLTTVDIEPSSAATALDIAGTQLSGALNIGNAASRTAGGTINIGTGGGRIGAINIGTGNPSVPSGGLNVLNLGTSNGGTTTISGGGVVIQPSISGYFCPNVAGVLCSIGNVLGTGGTIGIGEQAVAGAITIGTGLTTTSTTTIAIGNGTNQTGSINIGTGSTTFKIITIGNATGAGGTLNLGSATISIANAANTTALNLGTGMTSGAVILGGTTGGTSTLTLNRPITPAYLPSAANADTMIGYKANIAGLVLAANYPIATGNITTTAFTIPIGVFLVNVVVKVNFASALVGAVFLRLSLSTVSATSQDARTIDFNPNDAGNNFLNYTTTISASAATSYFLVGASGGTPNPTITAASTIVNITRIA